MKFTLFAAVILAIGFAIGALCWTYAVNEWLIFFGSPSRLAWWQGGLVGFIPGVGHAGLPVAVLTFILMLFLA